MKNKLKNELKQTEGIFPQNLVNDLDRTNLIVEQFIKLQDIIETDELHYKSKCRKVYNFSECSLPIVF